MARWAKAPRVSRARHASALKRGPRSLNSDCSKATCQLRRGDENPLFALSRFRKKAALGQVKQVRPGTLI